MVDASWRLARVQKRHSDMDGLLVAPATAEEGAQDQALCRLARLGAYRAALESPVEGTYLFFHSI